MMKYIVGLVLYGGIMACAISADNTEIELLSQNLNTVDQKTFIVGALSQKEILSWGSELWPTFLWGAVPEEDNLVKRIIAQAQAGSFYESISKVSAANYSAFKTDPSTVPAGKSFSLLASYNFSLFVRGVLLPKLAIDAKKQNWDDFMITYRQILFTVPLDAEFYHVGIAPLEIIVPQFVRYSSPPDSVLAEMEQEMDAVITYTLKGEAISGKKNTNINKLLVDLYAVKANLKIAKYYNSHKEWPDKLDIDLPSGDVNGKIDYEIQNGTYHYRLTVSGKYGVGYCGSFNGFNGHLPQIKDGKISEEEQKEISGEIGRWYSAKVQKIETDVTVPNTQGE